MLTLTDKIKRDLAAAALSAREQAYVPYSHFRVGAALLTKDGKIIKGCNIESAAYSPTNCAERTAFFKAVSEGERDFAAIAVAGGPEDGPINFCYPCGVCRQVMAEFVNADDFVILAVKSEDEFTEHTLAQLFPMGFGPGDLNK